MPTILTVEDSRAVRNIIAKQVLELGFGLEQAENGEEGLEKLAQRRIDLVLLDVTMPVLDGPGMLERMRSSGYRTPVIMLTSEAKRSIVAATLQLGISDYVLKPFGADELRSKILAVLSEGGAGEAPPVAPAPPVVEPAVAPAPKATAAAVLIVDDVEHVAKKLRALLPETYAVEHRATPSAALSACRAGAYKVILVDADLPAEEGQPDIKGAALVSSLRAAQPTAAIVALCLRTANDSTNELRAQGYADVLFKPFRPEGIGELVAKHLIEQEPPLTCDQDLLTLGSVVGKADVVVDGYFAALDARLPPAVDGVAAGCHEHVIVDLRKAPVEARRFTDVVAALASRARQVGLGTKLVVDPAGKRALAGAAATRVLWTFDSVATARATEVDPSADAPCAAESWISRMQDL